MTQIDEVDVASVAMRLGSGGLAEDVLRGGAPEGPLYEFADALLNHTSEEEQRATRLETWVTFTLAHETYGLPVANVMEILRVTGITRVPHAPRSVRGVTNMRGKVLAVVDLRSRLGLPAGEPTAEARILVSSTRGRLIGLLVDSVDQVERLDRNTVQPPPPDVMTSDSDYLIGVCQLGTRLAILLDVDRVLAPRTQEPAAARELGRQGD